MNRRWDYVPVSRLRVYACKSSPTAPTGNQAAPAKIVPIISPIIPTMTTSPDSTHAGFFPPEQRAHVLEHMNSDHADAVLRYARFFAGFKAATAARLTDIDAEAITLAVTLPHGEVGARLPFATPLAKPDDAHLTLVAMAKEARRRESLARAQESAAWFRREFKTVLLGTTSKDGAPDASVAPAALGDDHAFYVYVSTLSAHTANLLNTGRASLLLIEDESASNQLLARRRLTFPCSAQLVPREDARFSTIMAQLKGKFGKVMEHLETMTDFQLVRLLPAKGRLVTGFGQAYDVDPTNWEQLAHVGGGGHGQPHVHGGGHQPSTEAKG